MAATISLQQHCIQTLCAQSFLCLAFHMFLVALFGVGTTTAGSSLVLLVLTSPNPNQVQRALAAVAECDERWFKPTDWKRCEPNRAPQALPEAARKRYSPDYHPSSSLGFD